MGTDALDDDAMSICWRSAPQSAQRSFMIVVWRHSSISRSGDLKEIWLESSVVECKGNLLHSDCVAFLMQ